MSRQYNYWVYILSNALKTTTYIGVTNNLERRVFEHKSGTLSGFTKRYNVSRLIYCEVYNDIASAISREKQLKSWRREKKVELINTTNPNWDDLSKDW